VRAYPPAMPLESPEALAGLLRRVRSIAVLGAKAEPGSDAFRVADHMRRHGHRVLPVNPKLEEVFGERCVPRLADLPGPVDLVDVFRAPAHLPAHVEEILALPWRPRAVWLQLGIRHPDATARLEAAGIEVVEDRCLMVEHRRLLGAA